MLALGGGVVCLVPPSVPASRPAPVFAASASGDADGHEPIAVVLTGFFAAAIITVPCQPRPLGHGDRRGAEAISVTNRNVTGSFATVLISPEVVFVPDQAAIHSSSCRTTFSRRRSTSPPVADRGMAKSGAVTADSSG